MRGYLDDPAATARAISGDAWFRTGDVGHFDLHGCLVISGQVKPIIVLATGKKVAARPIEAALRASPLITDVTILGSGEPALRAVITPDMAGLVAAGVDGDERAMRSAIEQEIQDRLAGFARYEWPRTVELAPAGCLADTGRPRAARGHLDAPSRREHADRHSPTGWHPRPLLAGGARAHKSGARH